MAIVRGSFTLATFLLILGGCSGGEDSNKGGGTVQGDAVIEDTAANLEDTSSASDAADTGSSADTGQGTTDAGKSCPGGAGCPCSNNSECDLAVCLETSEGKVCAAACTDSTSCTSGQVCAQVTAPGGDTLNICVERTVRWCDPCKNNVDCGGPGISDAKCIDRGVKGAFCGLACGEGLPECPSGSSCQEAKDVEGNAVKQCMPEAGAECTCSPLAISKELTTPCFVGGGGNAACKGVRACLADGKEGAPDGGGLSACIGMSPIAETCNGVDDDCDGTTDEETACDDKDPCTVDACKEGKCSHEATTGACDDGDPCTDNDTCASGTCAGTAKACDDGDSCTKDSCDPTTGCVNAPQAGPCDDNDACTADDTCEAGACTGKPKSCDDGNACTVDSCDPQTGSCTSTLSAGPCDDGNPCTSGDTCQKQADTGDLKCVGGAPTDCDDKNPCTKDSCDPAKGCVATADPTATVPCYTGAPGTEGVGTCVGGKQACKADGSLGTCQGEVTPAGKETCDGKDETCDGQTDENCVGGGPPQVQWTIGSAVVTGASGNNTLRAFVGGPVAGPAKGAGSTSLDIGFYAWLSAWLK